MDMLTIDQVYEPDALERERRLERLTDPYRLWEAGDALAELKRLQAEKPGCLRAVYQPPRYRGRGRRAAQ